MSVDTFFSITSASFSFLPHLGQYRVSARIFITFYIIGIPVAGFAPACIRAVSTQLSPTLYRPCLTRNTHAVFHEGIRMGHITFTGLLVRADGIGPSQRLTQGVYSSFWNLTESLASHSSTHSPLNRPKGLYGGVTERCGGFCYSL